MDLKLWPQWKGPRDTGTGVTGWQDESASTSVGKTPSWIQLLSQEGTARGEEAFLRCCSPRNRKRTGCQWEANKNEQLPSSSSSLTLQPQGRNLIAVPIPVSCSKSSRVGLERETMA